MWPSQRVQNFSIIRTDSNGTSTSTSITPSSDQRFLNVSRSRPGGGEGLGTGGETSKIEISHTQTNTPSVLHRRRTTSSNSSVTYIKDHSHHQNDQNFDSDRKMVAFTKSGMRDPTAVKNGAIHSESSVFTTKSSTTTITTAGPFGSTMGSTSSSSGGGGNVHGNELVGQVVIHAMCNRDSVIQGLGGKCNCPGQMVEQSELKRIQELDQEEQQQELCKLMIRLVKEREDRNEELIALQAWQKLVRVTKPSKHQKTRHILCVRGRTLDGTNITSGNYPNSFSDKKQLMDLRRDPPGFKRFTARVDMRGFLDEEISMTNEDNILRILGARRKQEDRHAKMITEEVILPQGVYADCLRMGRTNKGILIIQEPWKF